MENDLISRNALESDLRDYADRKNANGENGLANGILSAVSRLKYAPAADAAPVVHGHLVDFYSGEYNDFANCSICGAENLAKAKFCCMCGAVMDGKDISK